MIETKLTPKALELLTKIKDGESYTMSCMGYLVFENNVRHSRQTMALKVGRFARQLINAGFIYHDSSTNFYRTTTKSRE